MQKLERKSESEDERQRGRPLEGERGEKQRREKNCKQKKIFFFK